MKKNNNTKIIGIFALSCLSLGFSTYGFTTPEDLANGLDSTEINWENGTANGWYNQNEVTFDGEDAITSYGPGDYATSMVSAVIEGPGVMRYYWKVSSEERYDFLLMGVDGQRKLAISGEKDWQEVEFYLEEGTHVVSFAYQRDESVSVGQDRGWVDLFSFSPGEEIAPPNLNDAFGVEGIDWVTSEFRPWSVSDEINDSNGSLIAESSTLDQPGVNSWVEAKISGPALVSFDSRLSEFASFGFEFEILIDEVVNVSQTWELSTTWDNIQLFIPSGVHTLRLQFATPVTFFSGSASLLVKNMSIQGFGIPVEDEGITLVDSLDSIDLFWDTFGGGEWYPQSEVTFDGEDAAVSGIAGLTGWQTYSILKTTVRGPGILDYKWYYSSDDSGIFQMFVNGYEAGQQWFEDEWIHREYSLPEGEYEIEFVHSDYSLDGIVTSYAILDQVNFSAGEQFELEDGQSSLADSINTGSLSWVTGGDSIWYSEEDSNGDGLIARADIPGQEGDSWILTEVVGPGMLDFEWGMQKPEGFIGALTLLLDGDLHSMISDNNDWEELSVYIEEGEHEVSIRYDNGPGQDTGLGAVTVRLRNVGFRAGDTPEPPAGSLPLGEALDAEQFDWVSAGDAAWFGQENVSFDNVDAASSGVIQDGRSTWMETIVDGPGKLSFKWRVSSEVDYDYLLFAINGEVFDNISGLTGWREREFYLGDGAHKIRFTYIKDYGDASGSDRGWVDEFNFEQGIGPEPDPSGITLTDALDFEGLIWNTGGDGKWVASTNTNVSRDGVDVAESGPVNSSMNYKWMATFVEGPANLSFYWRYN